MALSTHLKEWMEYYEVTSEMISFKTRMSVKVINKYMNCETTPSVAELQLISETIGVSIDDLLKNTPEKAIGNMKAQEKMHLIETTSIKTAVRLQNYLHSVERECRVIAIVGETENFIIQYDGDVLDVADIYKISKKFKYRDNREKESDPEARYLDMDLTRL